jgi:hypothetical protein
MSIDRIKQDSNIDLDILKPIVLKCHINDDGSKSPDIDDYEYTLVKGFVQSGKSFFIIYQSIIHCLSGYTTIILLRNKLGDVEQLKYRFNEILEKYNLQIKVKTPNSIMFKVKDYGNIILTLGNSVQLNKVYNTIVKYDLQGKYVFMIDEVDYLDSESGDKKSDLINQLKLFSRHVYGISATVTDPILQENIHKGFLKILKPLPIYKNIHNINWHIINENQNDTNDTNVPMKKQSIFEKDESLKDFIYKFSKWQPIYVKQYNDYHPVMYLIKSTRLIKEMWEIQDYITDNYDITTIVYNGDGIRLHIPTEEHIGIKGSKKLPSGYYHCKNISISQIIGYLKSSGGYKKYPRILLISGDLASRGISFVSNDYGKCLDSNLLGWHIIGEYYKCPKTVKQPELLQSLRLCGNIKDDIELRMYTTETLKNDIIKAYQLAEIFMTKGLELSKEKKMPVRDILQDIEIPAEKMIKGRKIARNKNNNDIEKSIKIVHFNTEEKIKNCAILLVLYNTLTILGKKYYNYFVETIKEEFGGNKWIEKSIVMNSVGKKHNIDPQLLTNTSHPWHDINKKLKRPHHSVYDNETTGLLFKLKNNKWYIKFIV